MTKPFQFLHNSLALFALVGIMVASLFTTLSLSPVAINTNPINQVAGASTIHNAYPVEAQLADSNVTGYQSSIKQNGTGDYSYNLNFGPQQRQLVQLTAFRLINSNPNPAEITVQVIAPRSVGSYLNIGIMDKGQTYGLYNALDGQSRTVTITVPSGSNLLYTLKIEAITAISFGGSFVVQLKSK